MWVAAELLSRSSMRYAALATDYDGTLAEDGSVSPDTLKALARLKEAGRALILVTGRELSDLMRVFPEYAMFDRLVVENGAVLYDPKAREERLLAEPASCALVERLRARGVTPLSVGRVIVATWEPHEHTVLEEIHALGLEHQVIFNKGAVMVLPPGVNKSSGLAAALSELHLSQHNVVGVGDAENDHALLSSSEVGVAVANALPMLKQRADLVTSAPRGAGVSELIERILVSDLRELEPVLSRYDLTLGTSEDGKPVSLHPYGRRVLLCGTSGSGKSTLSTAFLEELCQKGYQFCLVDPEGDYDSLPGAVVLGDEHNGPRSEEVAELLTTVEHSVVANLLGIKLEERPRFFTALLGRLTEYRARFGRPHWIVIDEAHHMLPEGSVALPEFVALPPSGFWLITVHPERVATSVLASIDTLIVVGDDPYHAFRSFAAATGREVPELPHAQLAPGEALLWSTGAGSVVHFKASEPKAERRRHRRKYAAGALGEDKSFYFRGPRDALNLRAQNLAMFVQIADGVDDDTWRHHLVQHDYSRWLREAIKNDELASEVESIERELPGDPRTGRQRIRQAIERVYTLPA
jgi:HAD superfamily hydrolase (TIGR01484 family)